MECFVMLFRLCTVLFQFKLLLFNVSFFVLPKVAAKKNLFTDRVFIFYLIKFDTCALAYSAV